MSGDSLGSESNRSDDEWEENREKGGTEYTEASSSAEKDVGTEDQWKGGDLSWCLLYIEFMNSVQWAHTGQNRSYVPTCGTLIFPVLFSFSPTKYLFCWQGYSSGTIFDIDTESSQPE